MVRDMQVYNEVSSFFINLYTIIVSYQNHQRHLGGQCFRRNKKCRLCSKCKKKNEFKISHGKDGKIVYSLFCTHTIKRIALIDLKMEIISCKNFDLCFKLCFFENFIFEKKRIII